MILITPKQEVEQKREWFCGVNFFCSNFKVEWENGVWTKIRFLASGFFVHDAISLWFLLFFSIFWIGFFLIGFSNPFIVRFRSSFLFSQRKFLELYIRNYPALFLSLIAYFMISFDSLSNYQFFELNENVQLNENIVGKMHSVGKRRRRIRIC